MTIVENIAANLSSWMESKSTLDTPKKLGKKCGVGATTIQRIKNGVGNPTISNLNNIANAFNRSTEELIAIPKKNIAVANLSAAEPNIPAYLNDQDEVIEYFSELDPEEAEIFKSDLKSAALRARKSKREKRDRELAAKAPDPPLGARRTA